MSQSDTIRTGSLARMSNVGHQTVLYYEKRGLLEPAGRSTAGHRLYTEEAVRTIRFIKNAQTLGFSLDEIGKLLIARKRKNGNCGPIAKRAALQLSSLRDQLKELKNREQKLSNLLERCSKGKAKMKDCVILEALETGSLA